MSNPDVSPAEIRSRLDHPVIDADGHIFEYMPALDTYLREEGIEGGSREVMGAASFDGTPLWQNLQEDERWAHRTYRSPWWGMPMANTLDFATSQAPALLYERLEELGLDYAVCYPSIGLNLPMNPDEKTRRRACRGLNRYLADSFAGLGDRLTPVAVIPTFTPAEALEELDWAVGEGGFKAAMIAGFAIRPVPGGQPGETWIDSLGLDSAHDYDPLWRRLVELRISPGVHSGSMGWSGRRSVTNFSYNHMGNFAGAGEATAKSIFFGGVLKRFPELRIAFLEGGVTWAVQMLADLVSHWEKRGPAGLEHYDPAALDAERFDELVAGHANGISAVSGYGELSKRGFATDHVVNDFEAAGITGPADIVEQITRSCFFGCEADDPLTGLAFDTRRNPRGATLNALFSSDIGHWDVPDMLGVLPEVYEHLEHDWLSPEQLRAFVCDNAARFYSESNPDFFRGTAVEDYVAGLAPRAQGA